MKAIPLNDIEYDPAIDNVISISIATLVRWWGRRWFDNLVDVSRGYRHAFIMYTSRVGTGRKRRCGARGYIAHRGR